MEGWYPTVQLAFRERLIRYVVIHMKEKQDLASIYGQVDGGTVWVADMFRDLFQKYPKVVTYKMVVSVLRDKRVFEDVTESEKERYGRRFRFRETVARLSTEEIIRLLLG